MSFEVLYFPHRQDILNKIEAAVIEIASIRRDLKDLSGKLKEFGDNQYTKQLIELDNYLSNIDGGLKDISLQLSMNEWNSGEIFNFKASLGNTEAFAFKARGLNEDLFDSGLFAQGEAEPTFYKRIRSLSDTALLIIQALHSSLQSNNAAHDAIGSAPGTFYSRPAIDENDLIRVEDDSEAAKMPKMYDSVEGWPQESIGGYDDLFGAEAYPDSASPDSAFPDSASPDFEEELSPPPFIPVPPAPSIPSESQNAERIKVRPAKINKVDFSVLTDEAVKPGKTSCIDVFMYTKAQRRIVDKALKNAAEKKTEATRSLTRTAVKQGAAVTVLLTSDDVAIENGIETMIWNGDALDFKFRFSVPENYKKKAADFACSILFDGIHITRLYFSVKMGSAKAVPVRFARKDSRRAFVSYSRKDKQRVIDRLIAIQEVAPRLRFWMDNQSMNAGDVWREAIKTAIKKADAFLLFWSVYAKQSAEVETEWRYALELERDKKRRRNGSGFITPVPLDKPSECPPPEELSALHFGDPSFDDDIENIEKVRFIEDKAKPKNIRFLG